MKVSIRSIFICIFLGVVFFTSCFQVNIFSHELFHIMGNKGVVERFCVEAGGDSFAHISIDKYTYNKGKDYLSFDDLDTEEKKADIFGMVVSFLFLIFCMFGVYHTKSYFKEAKK